MPSMRLFTQILTEQLLCVATELSTGALTVGKGPGLRVLHLLNLPNNLLEPLSCPPYPRLRGEK